MPTADPAKKFALLLKKLRATHGDGAGSSQPCPAGFDTADPAVHQLVYSFLLWESSTERAQAAFVGLHGSLVDYNELRVSFAEDLAKIIGESYPRAEERCARLRACLNDLFRREHAVALSQAVSAGRRDARQYVESLEGVPGYVAARVSLLCAAGHAVPVDQRLAALLSREGCCDPQVSPDAVGAWLERQVKPAEAAATHALLQAWSDAEGDSAPARVEPAREKAPARARAAVKPASRPPARQRPSDEKPKAEPRPRKKKTPAREKPEA